MEYALNPRAQQQLALLKPALEFAGYQVQRDRLYPHVWHLSVPAGAVCLLSYDGWAENGWWKITPEPIPTQILNLVQAVQAIGGGAE